LAHHAWSRLLIGAGWIGAPIYWRTEAPASLLITDENQFI
jgi:hypothetical protein